VSSYLKFDGKDDVVRFLLNWMDYPVEGACNQRFTVFVRFLSWPTTACAVWGDEASSSANGIFIGTTAYSRVQHLAARYVIQFPGPTYVPLTITAAGADGAGAPFHLGRVYKIQLAMETTAVPDSTAKLFVDGAEVATSTTAGWPIASYGGVRTSNLGGKVSSFAAVSPPRGAHMEILQAMFERNVTDPFDVDDSEPFTDLTLGAGADTSWSSVWPMNEGSGTSVEDTSGTNDLVLGNGGTDPPSWAPEADPTYATGSATFGFGSCEGLALRESDAPTVSPAPIYGPEGPVGDETAGKLRLARAGDWHWDDSEALTGIWSPTTEMTVSASQVFEGNDSIHADGTTGVQSTSPLFSPGTSPQWWLEWWFYDPGGTSSSRVQALGLASSTPSMRAAIGFVGAVSTTEYVTSFDGSNVASGVAVATGWHHFAIHVDHASDATYWIDGVLVRTEDATSLGSIARLMIAFDGESASNDDAYYDAIRVGASGSTANSVYAGLVESSGSIVLPLVQPPEGVRFFRGVAFTDETAGTSSMDVGGTVTYTFRHSTDGGSTWGSSTALTTANLRALACAGNGQDVLEITVAMTSGMDDIGSPEVSSVGVEYEPAVAGEPREIFVTQDQYTLSEAALNG
jgi:hypothetical protein